MSNETIKDLESSLTIRDLLKFCKSQAKFNMTNYYGSNEAYKLDSRSRRRGREAATRAAGLYMAETLKDTPLIQGKYFSTRLIIGYDKIEYIPGQYAPTEIYWALADYFKTVRGM